MEIQPKPLQEPLSNGLYSRYREAAQTILCAYNEWTLDSLLSFRDSHCVHEIRPHSLKIPTLTNSGYAKYIEPHIAGLKNYNLQIHDLVEDTEAKKMVLLVSSAADSSTGPYNTESTFILYLNEQGNKVVRFIEFVDSRIYLELSQELKEQIIKDEDECRHNMRKNFAAFAIN